MGSKYIVRLDLTKREFHSDLKKEFSDKKEAQWYEYHLKVSNFDNPYEIPVIFEEGEN